jgi:tRNA threonylcarbamoyladenosine biosynthesis protein TsaB
MLAALETSTRSCSVALFSLARNVMVGEMALPEESEGASVLLPALMELLTREGLTAVDLTAVVVSLGPGSFTGIRVGLATAQGLSLPDQKTVFGVTSLDALAENLRLDGWMGEALCLIDAQRGECFAGHYCVSEGSVESMGPPAIVAPKDFAGLLKGRANLVGPAALKYEKDIREVLGTRAFFPLLVSHRLRASSMASIAARRWQAGERPSMSDLTPLYLRMAAPDEIKK